jgi:hypothetical protein
MKQAFHAYNMENMDEKKRIEKVFQNTAIMPTIIVIVIKEEARLWITVREKHLSCIMLQ